MNTSRLTALAAALATTALLAAVFGSTATARSAHVMQNPAAAQWGPAPPMLPPGAKIAILSGDPTKAVPYAVRLKFPANYDIPAHSHPEDEHVVVVTGQLFAQMGNKLDRRSGMSLGVGGFALMPAHENHFAYTKAETTIVLYGQGPVEFTYVNPADDPRTSTSTKR